MGMHFGLVAVKVSAKEFVEIIPQIWPALEITASADKFSTNEDIETWMQQNENFVSAAKWTKDNPGTQCYLVSQHEEWSLFLDPGYTLAIDEVALQKLSVSYGKVLSFVVESTSACAFFCCYEAGALRRSIEYAVGESVQQSGTPLPEEKGIDVERYYVDETEALMKAFGLPLIDEIENPDTTITLALTDRTDYSAFKEKWLDNLKVNSQGAKTSSSQSSELSCKGKPWWKFW